MRVVKYQLGRLAPDGEDAPIFKEPPPDDAPPPIVKLSEPLPSAPPIVPEPPSGGGGLVPLALLVGAWFLL